MTQHSPWRTDIRTLLLHSRRSSRWTKRKRDRMRRSMNRMSRVLGRLKRSINRMMDALAVSRIEDIP